MLDKKTEKLIKELKQEEEKYYKGNPEIPDDIYDFKLRKLKILKGENGISSIGHIHSEIKKLKEKHLEPMLSLNNAFNQEELCLFFESIEKILKQEGHTNQENIEYFIEPKIDGMSISLHYKSGILIEAISRGDGIKGESLYEHVLRIDSIPKIIQTSKEFPEEMLIRGEIFILKSDFQNLKEEGKIFNSARNFVAGTLRLKNYEELRNKKLNFIAYRIIPIKEELNFESQEEIIQKLKQLGFSIHSKEYTKTIIGNRKNIKEITSFINEFGEKKKVLDIPNDGLVFKLNSLREYEKIGNTSKFPKWAIAYKYPSLVKSTTLKKITAKVGRSGRITYIGELEPIEIDGSLINYVSLHNYDNIKDLGLKEGSIVEVCKSGEIIPQIISAQPNSKLLQFEILTQCPCCGIPLVFNEGDKLQYCKNKNCEDKKLNQIIHFCSKQAVNIEGLSRGIIEKLNKKIKILNNILDIYSIKNYEKEIYNFKGLNIKKKLFTKLINSIEESKKASPQKILFSLGIDHIGEEASKLFLEKFSSLNELFQSTLEEKLGIPKIGPKSAYALEEWLKQEENITLINGLRELGFNFDSKKEIEFPKEVHNNYLFKKTALITGTFKLTREQIKQKLNQKYGLEFKNSFSSKIDYLIVGENPGSKVTKAIENEIKIINEEELNELLMEK